MASEIPVLGTPPLHLKTVEDFIVKGDPSIFPPGFLPKDTMIFIQPGVGVGYQLYWLLAGAEGKHCSIASLSSVEPGLKGENIEITIEGRESIYADVTIVPHLGSNHTYTGTIVVKAPRNTATTGTFVAQASPDGYGGPGSVKPI